MDDADPSVSHQRGAMSMNWEKDKESLSSTAAPQDMLNKILKPEGRNAHQTMIFFFLKSKQNHTSYVLSESPLFLSKD